MFALSTISCQISQKSENRPKMGVIHQSDRGLAGKTPIRTTEIQTRACQAGDSAVWTCPCSTVSAKIACKNPPRKLNIRRRGKKSEILASSGQRDRLPEDWCSEACKYWSTSISAMASPTESFVIKTPCSSANIGPGFDVIGLALSMYLELHVTIDRSKGESSEPLNCRITYEGEGEDSDDISLDPEANLITRVAIYVLRCHNQRTFPAETHVHIKNPIPLGRGLGSSGAAVVAGVQLGNECGRLNLDKGRLFDFCLMIGKQHVGACEYTLLDL